jgi:hypothetical protein
VRVINVLLKGVPEEACVSEEARRPPRQIGKSARDVVTSQALSRMIKVGQNG